MFAIQLASVAHVILFGSIVRRSVILASGAFEILPLFLTANLVHLRLGDGGLSTTGFLRCYQFPGGVLKVYYLLALNVGILACLSCCCSSVSRGVYA
jgi:hypothetical protein